MRGIHHVIMQVLSKDLFCRYKTLKGFQVNRKAGWDTHGLPVELGVEKSLNITKEHIGTTISMKITIQLCRTDVMKYKESGKNLTNEMGYWVDMDNPYVTYDNKYMKENGGYFLNFTKKDYFIKDLLYNHILPKQVQD